MPPTSSAPDLLLSSSGAHPSAIEEELLDVDSISDFIDHKAIHQKALMIVKSYTTAVAEQRSVEDALFPYRADLENIGWPNEHVQNVVLWFRRKLLRDARQRADMEQHRMRKIGKKGAPIVSQAVLASRRKQMNDQEKYMKNTEIISRNIEGNEVRIPCSDVFNSAEKRISKLYARATGLDRYCTAMGLVGFFLTLTLPPQFHPNPSKGKCSWNGASPAEGHDLMQARWRSWQRRFGKAISIRVEEQHLDGCIHWHAMVWVEDSREKELIEKLGAQFGPAPASVVLKMDSGKAKAGTYLMKYLMKTTVGGSEPGSGTAATAELADAHRATWGGRAIQIADVTGSASIWDEIRRVKYRSSNWCQFCFEGRALHSAAATNDYCEFLIILSRLNQDRSAKRCGIWYARTKRGSKIVKGIFIDNLLINNREKEWKISKKKCFKK